ncbi:MAG: ABC transporter ATP-binding protein [Candidatus Omnitrophica bacterium]|nr:ABC transporter ATP-binding protein [Candidatus Omnitrophota bacterium]
MREYLKLLRFAKPYVGLFGIGALFMALSALFDGFSLSMIVPLSDRVLAGKQIVMPTKVPDFLAAFIDKLNSIPPETMLVSLVFIVPVMILLKGVVNYFQTYIMSDIGQRVVRDIRLKLYVKLQSLSLEYFTQKRGGELISRITNDVKLVENAVAYGSTDLIYQTLLVVLFTFLLFFINWRMALTAFVLLPLISIPIVQVGKLLRKYSKKGQERMADINSLLYETILGARIVKAFNMEQEEIKKFQEINQAYYKISMKSIKRTQFIGPITEFMGSIAGVFVFYWGGRQVISGSLSFGVFALFLGSLFSLIRPFKKLSQVNSINQQALAANARIYEVLDTPVSVDEKRGAKELPSFKERILFEDVWFKYGNQEVLKGITLEVKKGQMVAIVGPSGVGKSTLLDLIPRFYDVAKGRVLIDSWDVRDVTLTSLRQQIGIVSQETILFNDTIRGNIAYGRHDVSLDEIQRAAQKAYAHDFIIALPQGYDTIIGDRGVKLSGGERQRIAIARALLKNPPILILDEATSQLDTESERIVQEALDRLIEGRTVLVIAHRLSTVKNAHRIVVLDKGKIAEQGSHSELLAKEGLFRRLNQMQEL